MILRVNEVFGVGNLKLNMGNNNIAKNPLTNNNDRECDFDNMLKSEITKLKEEVQNETTDKGKRI